MGHTSRRRGFKIVLSQSRHFLQNTRFRSRFDTFGLRLSERRYQFLFSFLHFFEFFFNFVRMILCSFGAILSSTFRRRNLRERLFHREYFIFKGVNLFR